jgi:hypothetical protein
MKACLYCSTREKLVVEMSMSLIEGESAISIQLCEEHKHKTQLASLKKAYQKRQEAIEKLKKMADQFGFKLSDESPQPRPQAITMPVPASTSTAQPQLAPQIIKAGKIEKIDNIQIDEGARANVPDDPDAPRHAAFKIDKKVNQRVQNQTLERSDGLPLTVPKQMVGDLGTTTIRITQNETNAQLQARFKRMGIQHDGEEPESDVNFKKGYAVKDCGLCGGSGVTKINNQRCQRCNGTGMASQT